MGTLRRVNQGLLTALYWGTAFSTAAFFLMVILGVFARYIIKSPILSAIELSRLFFVWACFLAAALCYYRQAHIAITFLVDKLTLRVQIIIRRFGHLLIALFFSSMLYHSAVVIVSLWPAELPITKISQSWLYLPVPVISFCCLLFTFEMMAQPTKTIQKSQF